MEQHRREQSAKPNSKTSWCTECRIAKVDLWLLMDVRSRAFLSLAFWVRGLGDESSRQICDIHNQYMGFLNRI